MQHELEGLDPTALLAVKRLIRAGLYEKNNPDAVNMRESYEQAARIASGVPGTLGHSVLSQHQLH